MHRILIVDDEQNVLNALRRELQGEYLVETYAKPDEALEHSRHTLFDLVIADYQMPDMNGIQFLKQFGKLQPDAARLMLSGEADFDAVAGTINETHIYRFIGKPWDSAELAATLAQALVHRTTLLENLRLAELCRKERHWQRAQDPNKLYQVLVVDDEPNVLSAVTRDLTARERFDDLHAALLHAADPESPVAHHDFRFNVHTATSPVQALERAKQVGYDVVISDYLMPEMDGLRFLDAIRQIQPDAARILFSGHADKDVLVNAINDSEIYGYIGKPWREHELKNTVSQAVAYSNLLRENRHLAELMSN
ncbi:MAG: response regulator [Gallionella sp.]|jgi:DNA-binding NtrC family response regulator|nr:response regulator [Gallionella sp.]MCK9353007.1 response regulator [Gallionella sp.]